MKLQQNIDFNGLGWIKREIDVTLRQAQEALEGYVEDSADSGLMRICAGYLHQVQGALRMVELYGAAMVADEMELLAQALFEGRIADPDEAYGVLLRGIVQLPNYLERVQEGHKDIPVVLLPLLNDLRACRGQKLLTESVLFSTGRIDEPVDLAVAALGAAAVPPAETSSRIDRVQRLRNAYELALLRWFKAPMDNDCQDRLIAILDRMVDLSTLTESRSLWWVGTAVMEAVRDGDLDASASLKLLFGQIDQQIRRFIVDGEDSLALKPPRELMQSLLYYVAHSSATGARVSDVRRAYQLQDVLPTDGEVQQAEGAMAGHNRTLLNTVSGAIKDDLLRVKELLDVFLRTRDPDPALLLEPAEVLDRVGDTLGMLGLGVPRKLVEEQRVVIENMGSSRDAIDDARLLDVARSLLVVETSLDDHIDRLGGQSEPMQSATGELELPKAEVRKILDALMREAASNVQQVKLDIVAFIESPWDHARVEPIPQLLDEIAGAMNMLDLGAAAEVMTGIRRFIQTELLANQVVPSATQMDHLADALASIEYYLDATREQRAGRENILQVTERALEALGYWPLPAGELASARSVVPVETARPSDNDQQRTVQVVAPPPSGGRVGHELLEAAPVPGWLEGIDAADVVSSGPQQAVEQPPPTRQPPSGPFASFGFQEISTEGIDHDIRDVFLEEVDDEIDRLRSDLRDWLAAPDERATLVPIRRSFHTLKGSGRLVGASALGEFSWRIESLLNRVLDGTVLPGLDVQAVVKDGIAALPALAAALRNGGTPPVDVGDILDRASELVSSDDPLRPLSSVAPSATGGATDEPVVPDQSPKAGPDIDPALLEILTAEVTMHVAAIDAYLEDASATATPVTDELLRAVHTLNGALAMVDVPSLSNVLGPLEGYVRRLHAVDRVPDSVGLAALRQATDLVRDAGISLELGEPLPAEPVGLAGQILVLRDALPDPSSTSAKRGGGTNVDALEGFAIDDSEGMPSIDLSGEFDEEELDALLGAFPDGDTLPLPPDPAPATDDGPVAEWTKPDGFSIEAQSIDGSSIAFSVVDSEATQPAAGLATAPDDEFPVDPDGSSAAADAVGDDVSPLESRLDLADVDDDLLEVFLQEAAELLDHCDGLMADLHGGDQGSTALAGLQRDLHTLKGGARMSGLVAIGDLGHAMESLLEGVQEGVRPIDRRGVEILQSGFDRLHEMVQGVNQRLAIGVPAPTLARLEAWIQGRDDLSDATPAGAAGTSPQTIDAGFAESGAGNAIDTAVETAEVVEVIEIAEVTGQKATQPSLDGPRPDAPPTPSATIIPIKPRVPETQVPPPMAVASIAPSPVPASGVAIAPGTPDDDAPRQAQEMIRVRADLLDALVNHAGEVSIYRSRLDQQNASFRFNLVEFDQTITRLREQLRKFEIETEAQIVARYQRDHEGDDKPVFDPLELDRFSQLQQYSRSLAESVSDLVSIQNLLEDLTRQTDTLLLAQSRVSSELQDGLMRTRMVPFESLVPTLRRTLRQAAQEVGKRAQLRVEGAQGEMDRNLLERMKAPFEHMLRNALAHAIESPEERVQAGKPDEGTVAISVSRDATEVVLRVSDDGRGLDADAIRRRAVERGLMRADQSLSDRDIHPFILESGFSTSAQVTKLAGRGVGMDVVHNEIKQLGGSLAIDSTPGQGTTFTIRLPFTLAVTQAIVVKLGDSTYAIPMTSVQGVSRIERDDLQARIATAAPAFDYSGDSYDIYDLANLLDEPLGRAPDDLQLPLLLTRTGDQRAAVRVDSVAGSREVVVKSVGPQVSSVPGIFGATIMGDGSVVMILDLAPLVRRAAAMRSQMPAEAIVESLQLRDAADDDDAARLPLVMVVDDSITMRKVTQRVLERADMEVITAKDGIDAVEKLQERTPDLMLLDIEMPRMDGYELASYMKNDSRLRPVPIMMITSRSGDKHRQRAMEIGVERYLGKPYQEADLLRQVQEMLEARHG